MRIKPNPKTAARTCAVLFVAAMLLASSDARAKQIKLDVALDTPILMAEKKQTAYLRVAMTGFEFDDAGARPPVNVAIVLDKSGSMQGAKLAKAKDAAIRAIDKLRDDDIVSVVVYDTTVNVVVPATKVSDRHTIYSAIRGLRPGGNTALFAGVSKGAHEVRKFLDRERVNRVILLSDGLANIGPSSPGELAELGASLGAEGVPVTTIGLGLDYNEKLMARLAMRSDGNHFFAETAKDLERAYAAEFGDVLSVVAQEVHVRIACAEGIRPVRVLGRDADIAGRTVTASLNQIYGKQMKYILLEVEVPPGKAGQDRDVARVDVSYANVTTSRQDDMSRRVSVAFTDTPENVEAGSNPKVRGSVARQVGAERNKAAMELRDEGKLTEAEQLLKSNAVFLRQQADKLDNEWLLKDARSNDLDGANLDEKNWKRQRKEMESKQFEAVQSLGYID